MGFISRKNLRFIFVVIILIVVLFISSRGADNPVKGVLLGASSPFLKTFRIFAGGFQGLFHFLGSIGDLKNENQDLMEKNKGLLAEGARLKDVEKENEALRKELGLIPKNRYELEASFIIAQDPQGLGNFFIIDKGENKGIKTEMPVIVSNGILVGKVTEVYPNSAKILLLTDQNSSVNAEVTDSGARGIIKGVYGLGVMMDMISQAEVIKEGDEVITSGLSNETPRGLYIGKIGQAGQSGDKLFQQADIILPVDLSALRVVFVIKKF
jgi:rod shape-determining protein MreC